MTSLRILQLATSTGGGAGIAARRTHEALIEQNINSTLFTLTKHFDSKHTYEIDRNLVDRIRSSTLTFIQSMLFQSTDQLITPKGFDVFWKSKSILENYDVIHIHAFYNMLDTSSIAKLCESYPTKKFFVTLHDQRFLTGGCHYSNGCQQMYSGCTSCPQATLIGKIFVRKDFETKLEEFKKLTNLELIVPSLWLQEQARKSPFLSGFTVHLIRNPVPNVFFQKNSNITPPDKPAIIFISAQLGTKMKGLSVLVQALNLLAESGHSQEFELKLIGTGNFDVEIDPRISVKKIVTKSDFETSEELRRGKILVVPSIQDNLPSTMVEAICSGLSVIGSRTGGITEILTSYDQDLVTVGDYKTLSERLLSLLRKKNSIDIEKARKEFSNRSIAAQLFKVYSGTTLPY